MNLDKANTLMCINGIKLSVERAYAYLEAIENGFRPREGMSEHSLKIWKARIKGLIAAVQLDGRVHPVWAPNATISGRWACTKPNIQNTMPELRTLFEAEDGMSFIQADMCQIDYRVFAFLAGETIDKNEDIHADTAARLNLGRHDAKIINHAVNYGMTAYGLACVVSGKSVAKKPMISDDEISLSQSLINRYWDEYQNRRIFKDTKIAEAFEQGFLETELLNRRIEYDYSDDKADEKVFAAYIQGTAADIMKMWFIEASNRGYKVAATLHDSLVWEVGTIQEEGCIKEDTEHMIEEATGYSFVSVDIKVGKQWF